MAFVFENTGKADPNPATIRREFRRKKNSEADKNGKSRFENSASGAETGTGDPVSHAMGRLRIRKRRRADQYGSSLDAIAGTQPCVADYDGRQTAMEKEFRLTNPPKFEPGRRGLDYYPTPLWAIDALLDACQPPTKIVIEPSAGDGAIVRALCKRGFVVEACEVQEDFGPSLIDSGSRHNWIGDFFTLAPTIKAEFAGLDKSTGHRIEASTPFSIVGNPPYNLAIEFARTCLEIGAEYVALLLRLGILESQERREFWHKNPPQGLFPLAQRPSFTGDGATDGQAYAWFVWSRVLKVEVEGKIGPHACALMVL